MKRYLREWKLSNWPALARKRENFKSKAESEMISLEGWRIPSFYKVWIIYFFKTVFETIDIPHKFTYRKICLHRTNEWVNALPCESDSISGAN